MPRLARLDAPGVLNYIIIRWIERRVIFRSVFGNTPAAAKRSYAAYVKAGYGQGRRPELAGGRLIRSLGGWAASKKLRLKGQDRLKGDDRILGDSDFVTSILAEANEKLDRYYELKNQGYTIGKVEKRVMEIFGVEKDVIYSKWQQEVCCVIGPCASWDLRPPN